MHIFWNKGIGHNFSCPVWRVFDKIPVDGPYAENPLYLADCNRSVFCLPVGCMQKYGKIASPFCMHARQPKILGVSLMLWERLSSRESFLGRHCRSRLESRSHKNISSASYFSGMSPKSF
jgi:hypothetical protein